MLCRLPERNERKDGEVHHQKKPTDLRKHHHHLDLAERTLEHSYVTYNSKCTADQVWWLHQLGAVKGHCSAVVILEKMSAVKKIQLSPILSDIHQSSSGRRSAHRPPDIAIHTVTKSYHNAWCRIEVLDAKWVKRAHGDLSQFPSTDAVRRLPRES
ncbi:hypothetical protein BC830DRAFT_403397 [Chytriomyces sp. MP71]|nr:hypothetical protein BC830DRAFT_403397 [Chytriomyces sp. MP71]